MGTSNHISPLERFRNAKYIRLTTYAASGKALSTPIWFAIDAERIVAFTGAQTGKAKRIQRNPTVTVGLCSFNGTATGPEVQATARILPDSEGDAVMALIRRKYRVTKPLLNAVVGLIRFVARKPQTHSVYLEIRLQDDVSA